jgi:hypothetical protein
MDTPGGLQNMAFCTESGLYSLVLSCQGARQEGSASHRFRRWVTHDVLPSIRQTGQYNNESAAVRLAETKQQELTLRAGLARDLIPLWAAQRESCDPDDLRQLNYYRSKEAGVLEAMQSMMCGGAPGRIEDAADEPPQTITEIMDAMGGRYRTYAGQARNRIYVGRRTAAHFRERYPGEEPLTTIKLMDTGHRTPVKCYSERDWPWIRDVVRDCFGDDLSTT